jgi:hypothetical protein
MESNLGLSIIRSARAEPLTRDYAQRSCSKLLSLASFATLRNRLVSMGEGFGSPGMSESVPGVEITDEKAPFVEVVAEALGLKKLRIVETGGNVYP